MAEKIISDEILLVPFSGEEISVGEYGGDSLRDEAVEKSKFAKAVSTRISDLSVGLQEFLMQVDRLLKSAPGALSDYKLDEIEVSAGISIDGKFVLFGIGSEGGIEGGMTFTFKKISKEP